MQCRISPVAEILQHKTKHLSSVFHFSISLSSSVHACHWLTKIPKWSAGMGHPIKMRNLSALRAFMHLLRCFVALILPGYWSESPDYTSELGTLGEGKLSGWIRTQCQTDPPNQMDVLTRTPFHPHLDHCSFYADNFLTRGSFLLQLFVSKF